MGCCTAQMLKTVLQHWRKSSPGCLVCIFTSRTSLLEPCYWSRSTSSVSRLTILQLHTDWPALIDGEQPPGR